MSPAPPSRRVWLAGFALAAAQAALAQTAGQTSPPARDPLANRFGGPFTLTDHHGRRVSDKDFHGAFALLYFGFTRCTDTCPVDLPMIAAALDRLGETAAKLQPLMITVDPEDGPAALKDYLAAIHPRFLGLTGSESELAAVARAFRVHRRKLSTAQGLLVDDRPATTLIRLAPGETHLAHAGHRFTIDHGSLAYLMGPDGRFLTLFPHNSGIERYIEVLRRYLAP